MFKYTVMLIIFAATGLENEDSLKLKNSIQDNESSNISTTLLQVLEVFYNINFITLML